MNLGLTTFQSFSGAWFSFTSGTNVTLSGTGSQDPEWGWVDGHGQAWWNANEQDNRPHGWAFSKINGGVIKGMKLWKVRHSAKLIGLNAELTIWTLANRMELCHEWFFKHSRI